jgi:hypothetical protein
MKPDPRAWIAASLALFGCTGAIGSGHEDVPGTADSPGAPAKGASSGASPGGGTPAGAACGGAEPTRLWELTPEQYTRTAQALLGTKTRPGDELDQGQSRQASAALSEAHVVALYEAARRLATEASADPAKLHPCLATGLGDPTCVRTFLQDFLARAFRRDVAAAEVDAYAGFFARQAAAADGKTALRLTLRAIFGSLDFVFRTELGPDGGKPGQLIKLTPAERASALSYYLTDGPPDAQLASAARGGGLETREQVLAQAKRLLATPDAAAGVLRFFREHFRTHEILASQKDTKLFPAWTPDVPGDLDREADLFVQNVLYQDGAKLQALLAAGYSFANARLAALYGLPAGTAPSKDAFVKTAMPGNRAGLLTTGAVMARLARINDTAPVARGLFVREMVLCQGAPPPPPDVNAVPPPPDGKRTQRQRLTQHGADARCASCHGFFDPVGLAFESYDAVGKYRTSDVGMPIDASGTITGIHPDSARFSGPSELAQLLAAAPEAQACMASRLYAHARGIGDVPADRQCSIEKLALQLASSGGDLLALAAAVAADDGFFQRRVPGP